MKKIALLMLYAVVILISFQYRESIIGWIEAGGDTYHLPIMFGISIFLALFPIIPFTIFAGLMGAKYGLAIGGLINWVGSVGAAIVMFSFTRHIFADRTREYVKKYKRVKKFTLLFEKNSFLAVMVARFIPIVPPAVVNIYSAISTMSLASYIVATAIGKIPTMMAFAFLGDQLFSSGENMVNGLGIYILFIILVLVIYRLWLKKKYIKEAI
jgi:uncharacterized membrane protein YdjX (TVP38/TMEM64 family)